MNKLFKMTMNSTVRQKILTAMMIAIFVLGAEAQEQVKAPDQFIEQTPAVPERNCEKPRWPKSALNDESHGTVKLEFLIDVSGQVIDSRVIESSGYKALDEAARKGIAKCKFKPAIVEGKPVEEWHPMSYSWTIK
jgi:protein TonB